MTEAQPPGKRRLRFAAHISRFYDSALGRFTSADTIIPPHQGMQAWDRFAFVNNNPVRYTDPSGHMVASDDDGGCYLCTQLPNGGGSSGGNGGGNDNNNNSPNPGAGDECNVGHCYETQNIVCPAEYACTAEEMKAYALMFQYPGQLPWDIVQNGNTYFVFPAPALVQIFGNPLLYLSGAIIVEISDDRLTLINHSHPTHIFHNGQVEKQYTQNADGSWSVKTTGTGTNVWSPIIDQANNAVGPSTFNAVDGMMSAYIQFDQQILPTLYMQLFD